MHGCNAVRRSSHKLLFESIYVIGIFFQLTVAGTAFAAEIDRYPTGPVRAVVPYAPGGGTDVIARLVGAKLTERWNGNPLVVDNRAGASTVIGTEIVARAPADGYTLLVTTGTLAVNATLVKKLNYDTLTAFEPVSLLGIAANVLIVHPSLPVKTVKEFVALAKSKPGALSYSSSGAGGTGHLAMEMLKQSAGIDLIHVPYRGAGPAVTALVSGEVATSITNLIAALPQIKGGRMRVLAVTSARRTATLADVPTIAESGYPGFDASGWFAVFAPAKTPQPIITRLANDFRSAVKTPEVLQGLAAQGADAVGSTPEELGKLMSAEVVRWRRVLNAANIKAE